jgi:hypothetical protein
MSYEYNLACVLDLNILKTFAVRLLSLKGSARLR